MWAARSRPLGDPPLFVGFLRGVDFFWTARHLWLQTAIVAVLVLALFLVVDWLLRRGEKIAAKRRMRPNRSRIRGTINLALIALIIARDPALGGVEARCVVLDVFGTKARIAEPRARRRAHR